MSNDVPDVVETLATAAAIASFEARFVWLWTWVDTHVAVCENVLAAAGKSMYDVTSCDLTSLHSADASDADMVLELLGHLGWLDAEIGRYDALELQAQTYPGADDERFVIVRSQRPAMAPPSNRFTMASAGGSVRTYASAHACVPKAQPLNGALMSGPIGSELERIAASGRLRVDAVPTALGAAKTPQWTVTVTDRVQALEQLVAAIFQAAEDEVDVLLLPELSLPAHTLTGPGGVRAQIDSANPALVVAGIEHHHDADGDWVNVAVIVDRFGNELHRQNKVTRVAMHGAWETHQTGTQTVLAPSALGLIATPICRDLFHVDASSAPADSAATLNLCPSLSPKTAEHQTAADVARQRTGAVTAVCNRWGVAGEEMYPEVGPSFVLIPRGEPEVATGTDRIDITWT